MRNRTVLAIAELAEEAFTFPNMTTHQTVQCVDWFCEMLFAHEPLEQALLVNARRIPLASGAIKRFVQDTWLGVRAHPADGAELMRQLAEAILGYWEAAQGAQRSVIMHRNADRERLLRTLALDGYEWRNGRLLRSETEIVDVPGTQHVIVALYQELGLPNIEQLRHDMDETETLFTTGHWRGAITHARSAFEYIQLVVGREWTRDRGGLADERPVTVRQRLRATDFYTEHDFNFIWRLYGLVSEQGPHPNLPEQDSARLCRLHALGAAHFILLRFQRLTAAAIPTT